MPIIRDDVVSNKIPLRFAGIPNWFYHFIAALEQGIDAEQMRILIET